jgi:ABC-type transporter lipoprotein component MlaA
MKRYMLFKRRVKKDSKYNFNGVIDRIPLLPVANTYTILGYQYYRSGRDMRAQIKSLFYYDENDERQYN